MTKAEWWRGACNATPAGVWVPVFAAARPFDCAEGEALEAPGGDDSMKTREFGIRYWRLSWSVGAGVFLLISFLTGNRALEPLATFLLRPGAGLATVAGFGGHDAQGFFLYLLGNLAVYCALFLALFRFLKIGRRAG
jgi:hypothetical protein